jgi:hypothetical protein
MVAAAGVGVIGLIGVDFKGFAHARFEGHSSNLRAKIVFLDAGPSRTIMLQGVGCSVGSCSRHAIGGRAASDSLVNTSLDTIAAIKETTEDDAVFVLKNGTGSVSICRPASRFRPPTLLKSRFPRTEL